jgi:hypothetical protein
MSIGVAIRAAVRSAPRVDGWPHGTRTGDGWMVEEEAGAAQGRLAVSGLAGKFWREPL